MVVLSDDGLVFFNACHALMLRSVLAMILPAIGQNRRYSATTHRDGSRRSHLRCGRKRL